MWLMLATLPRSTPHSAVYRKFSDIVHWLANGNRSEYRPSTAFSLLKLKLSVRKGCCCHVGLPNAKFSIKTTIIALIMSYILWLENININYLSIRIPDNIVTNEKITISNTWTNLKHYILTKSWMVTKPRVTQSVF